MEVIMESQKSRRLFLKDCAKMGGACCAFLACQRFLPAEGGLQNTKPIDLAELSSCGIPCVKVCPLYKATQEYDVKMKKLLYERQEMKKKFGLEFDPDKVFCFTCKPGDKPKKVGMDTCPVRQCALANGVESCVQCANLDACDKEYWKKWPGQYASTKMIQSRYRTQPGAVIKDGKAR
jgi:hypothetical protein